MPVSTPPIAATVTTETIKGAGVGNHTRNMRGKRPMKVVIPINNGTNLLVRAFSQIVLILGRTDCGWKEGMGKQNRGYRRCARLNLGLRL